VVLGFVFLPDVLADPGAALSIHWAQLDFENGSELFWFWCWLWCWLSLGRWVGVGVGWHICLGSRSRTRRRRGSGGGGTEIAGWFRGCHVDSVDRDKLLGMVKLVGGWNGNLIVTMMMMMMNGRLVVEGCGREKVARSRRKFNNLQGCC